MSDDPGIEAEIAVLGAVLTDGDNALADAPLRAEDFSRPAHRGLWSLMVTMAAATVPISPVTVADRLIATPVAGIDLAYLHTLYAAVATTSNVSYYAQIVRQYADLRAIQAAGQRMTQATTIGDAETAKVHARETLDRLDLRDTGSHARPIADIIVEAMRSIEAGKPPGLTTPWPDLDRYLGGLRPGGLYVVGARPGLGKSIVGLQLAIHCADKHGSALMHSLEMPSGELGLRILSATSQVDFASLSGKPNDIEWARLTRYGVPAMELPLDIDDRATITIAEISASARRAARKGLELLVVDYLQLVTPTDRKAPREQQVSEASRALKLLAKDLRIPVVVLAQLNRNSTTRADPRPTLSDLRESGSIEQDADVVLLLYRDEGRDSDGLEVGIAKNRQGPRASVALKWDARHMRVTSSTWQVA